MKSFFLLCLSILLTSYLAAKPHIILMVLDDVGRTDTGVYGKSNVPMPNLIKLSQDGAVLENFYTQTVCSPTRSSLMTGRFPFRFGMQHFGTQNPGMLAGIPLDTPILPGLLREKGYDTHMIGKWHCGYSTWDHTPTKRGFQTYTGYMQSEGDYYKHSYGTDQVIESKVISGYDFWQNTRPFHEAIGNYSLDIYRTALTKVLTTYATNHPTDELRESHPLFVYMAHQTVHAPLQPRNDEAERCANIQLKYRRIYCSMLVELDDAIGEMVKQLKDLNLWENTLILVMSDNGGMVNSVPDPNTGGPSILGSQGSNYPLRGSKTTLFDGGVRSLAFVSGGIIPENIKGYRFPGLAHVVDFSASILTAAGVLPLKREQLKADGHDLLHSIFTQNPHNFPRTDVPINIVRGGLRYSAIRFGKYKLIVNDNLFPASRGWFDENGNLITPAEPNETKKKMLFNLEEDVEERNDISASNPQLVQYGLDLIQSYIIGGDYMEPQESPTYFDLRALPQLHGGVWKPYMTSEEWNKKFAEMKQKKNYFEIPRDLN